MSDNGSVAGLSENGIDPLTGHLAQEAILWGKDGSINDLGTLGGNDSVAGAVNNRGQVVGGALNTIPDPFTGQCTHNEKCGLDPELTSDSSAHPLGN